METQQPLDRMVRDPYYADRVGLADFDIPPEVRRARGRYNRWIAMRDHIARIIERDEDFVTRALLAPMDIRVLISEILTSKTRDEENKPIDADQPLPELPKVRLATVDGKPLALAARDKQGRIIADTKDPSAHFRGIKIGQRKYDAKGLRRARQIGVEVGIYREYPADFEVPADVAFQLLGKVGYRIVYPTMSARNTPKAKLRAPLFEVNGPFHDDVVATFGWQDRRG